jgi:Leucine-rich repeat (LRR) protein
MVNAQEWLDKNYPKNGTCIRKDAENDNYEDYGKRRKEVEELDIGDKGLEGNLDLSDFVNLEKLDCNNNQLTDLNLTECIKLEELICYFNKFTELKLTNLANLKKFDLSYNEGLLKLDCSNCQLTTLGLYNNSLIELNCSNNQFDSLRFLVGNGCQDLTLLNASNNKIAYDDGDYYGPNDINLADAVGNSHSLKKINLSNNPLSINLEPFQY